MDWISMLVTVLVLLLTLIIVYVLYMSRNFLEFHMMGIPYEKPRPAMGNVPDMIKEGIMLCILRMYNKYENEKVYGTYMPGVSILHIRDPGMIRDICIKHFSSFTDRRHFSKEGPFGSLLTVLRGEEWKRVRNVVSPTFSSGKLKRMCPHIEQAVHVLLGNLRETHEKDEALELKEVMSCFAMDAIASSGFGVEINTLKDKNSPFVTHSKSIMVQSRKVVGIIFLFPFLTKYLIKFGFFASEATNYFGSFVKEVMAHRRDQVTSHKRNDFLQLLVDSEETDTETETGDSEKKYLTRNEIQSLGIAFILASYDTVGTMLSMCLFVLANEHDCLQKVQEELDRVLGGKCPTYEQIQELVYLDMCLSETLRLYPVNYALSRVCTEDCVVQGFKIRKGLQIQIPIIGIHRDPNLWKDPLTFDPERFNATNKETHHPFAYLPFGLGPRNCVGMRLALLEMKMALAFILQEMTPVPCDKTVYPINLNSSNMGAKDGLWVKIIPREKP